jgi:hypothetical protein
MGQTGRSADCPNSFLLGRALKSARFREFGHVPILAAACSTLALTTSIRLADKSPFPWTRQASPLGLAQVPTANLPLQLPGVEVARQMGRSISAIYSRRRDLELLDGRRRRRG